MSSTQELWHSAGGFLGLYKGVDKLPRTRRTAQRRSSEAALILVPFLAFPPLLPPGTITEGLTVLFAKREF